MAALPSILAYSGSSDDKIDLKNKAKLKEIVDS
jgi:hypothetical protein